MSAFDRRRSKGGLRRAIAAALASAIGAIGCVRTEYVHRPAFYADASGRPLEEEWTKPDGTRVVVSSRRREDPDAPAKLQVMRVEILDETDEQRKEREEKEAREGIKALELREEKPDGTIVLRAWSPDQVLGHLMNGLRNEEYDPLYQQLLDPEVRAKWEASGGGPEAWRAFCSQNRRELMAMINRMSFSMLGGDVVIEKFGTNSLRMRFSPRLEPQFRFKSIEMRYIGDGMKLTAIRE
ncbi:MAG: hypothetical protein FJ253_03685 [Phycisphaerae bacterium]|nr:hypothetical protein [Phycisphaerae bacterium]